eukprot:13222036-Alexandrium_andersonii.AAC.1
MEWVPRGGRGERSILQDCHEGAPKRTECRHGSGSVRPVVHELLWRCNLRSHFRSTRRQRVSRCR